MAGSPGIGVLLLTVSPWMMGRERNPNRDDSFRSQLTGRRVAAGRKLRKPGRDARTDMAAPSVEFTGDMADGLRARFKTPRLILLAFSSPLPAQTGLEGAPAPSGAGSLDSGQEKTQ